jgi:hypothetical protein
MQRNLFKGGILLRDANENCISCGGNDKDLWDGGILKKLFWCNFLILH